MDLLDIEDINNSLDLELEKNKLTREELINICEQSVVSYGSWSDRDSYSAQVNVADIYKLLKGGCDFEYNIENNRTIWVSFINVTKEQLDEVENHYLSIDSIEDYFEEYGRDSEMFYGYPFSIKKDAFKTVAIDDKEKGDIFFMECYTEHLGGYLPTEARLKEANGDDWYYC